MSLSAPVQPYVRNRTVIAAATACAAVPFVA
jgi:hypothetical protein